jgi:uncharacterized membrane protein YkvA (DUF1232 family)
MLGRIGIILALWKTARLAWRLLWDGRVPLYLKPTVGLVLLYLVSPVGRVLSFIPVFGQLDDFTVIMVSVLLFVRMCPRELVSEHLEAMAGRPKRKPPVDPEKVIDGEYRFLD